MEYIGKDTEVYKDSVEFTGGIHRYINIEYSGIGGIQSYRKIQWNL